MWKNAVEYLQWATKKDMENITYKVANSIDIVHSLKNEIEGFPEAYQYKLQFKLSMLEQVLMSIADVASHE